MNQHFNEVFDLISQITCYKLNRCPRDVAHLSSSCPPSGSHGSSSYSISSFYSISSSYSISSCYSTSGSLDIQFLPAILPDIQLLLVIQLLPAIQPAIKLLPAIYPTTAPCSARNPACHLASIYYLAPPRSLLAVRSRCAGLLLLFPLGCACGGVARRGGRLVGKVGLSEKVVLVRLAVEGGAVEEGSRFLSARRVLGRAITTCAIKPCAIKAGVVEVDSGSYS